MVIAGPHYFLDCLPSSERQICFFFFGFSLIVEVSVVINLFFVCSATVDYCLLIEKKGFSTGQSEAEEGGPCLHYNRAVGLGILGFQNNGQYSLGSTHSIWLASMH